MKHNQQHKPKEVRTEKKNKNKNMPWNSLLGAVFTEKKMQHLPIFTTIQTFHIQAVRGSFVSNDYRGPRGDSDVLRSGSHSQSLLNTWPYDAPACTSFGGDFRSESGVKTNNVDISRNNSWTRECMSQEEGISVVHLCTCPAGQLW